MTGKTLGLVLAGGASQRFGRDKALALLGGKPVVAHVAALARGQVDDLVLNAAADAAGTRLRVLADRTSGEGPLSGWLAGLRFANENGFDFVATFACDTPFFPSDTVARLHLALSEGADCAMPRSNGQVHHTFALVRATSLPRVDEAFASGQRAIKALARVLRCAFADFSDNSDGPSGDVFFNINQSDDLIVAEHWLAEQGR